MKQVFRTTRKYWATEDGFSFVIGLLLSAITLYLGSWWLAVLLVLLAASGLPAVRRLWYARLEIDEQTLVVADEAEPACIQWKDLLYASLLESHIKPRKSLCLGIGNAQQSREVVIPLDHFDHQRIWQLVELYAPPAALAKDAHRQVAAYQEWEAEQKERVSHSLATLKVSDAWWVKGSAWLMFLMSGFFAWFFFTDGGEGRVFGTLLSLAFALLGGYAILITGTVEVNQEAITRKVPLGWYSIRWDEIKLVSRDPYDALVFCGEDKYLAITGPAYWSGENRFEVADFINAQIDLRRLEVKLISANFSFAKNTKIK